MSSDPGRSRPPEPRRELDRARGRPHVPCRGDRDTQIVDAREPVPRIHRERAAGDRSEITTKA
jgi:hypothetical protein